MAEILFDNGKTQIEHDDAATRRIQFCAAPASIED